MTVEELAGEMRPDAELRAKALELARTTARLAMENEALKKRVRELEALGRSQAERIAQQSELLSRSAESPGR